MEENKISNNQQHKEVTETLEEGVEIVSSVNTGGEENTKDVETQAEKEIVINPEEIIPLKNQGQSSIQITEEELGIKKEIPIQSTTKMEEKNTPTIINKTSDILSKKENEDEEKKSVSKEKQEVKPVLKTVRTYQGDVANILKTQKPSLTKMMMAENEKRGQKEVVKKKINIKPKTVLIILGIILIGIVGTVGFIYINKIINAPEIEITELKIPTIIFPNYQREIYLSSLKKDKITSAIANENIKTSIPLGSVIQFYFTKDDQSKQFTVEGTNGNKILLTVESFFNTLEAKIPSSLVRAIDPDFVFGFHSSLGNNPFVILNIKSYENAFAGMLNWEKTIYKELISIFKKENSQLEESGIFVFKDIVILNKDVRAILNKQGKIEFAYSFPSKDTLVIVNNETTLEELFRRINTAGLERKN